MTDSSMRAGSRAGNIGSTNRLRLAICGFVLLVIVLLWAGVFVITKHEREQAIADVMTSNANLARTFEEHTIRTLNAIDQLALLIKTQYEKQGLKFDMVQFFEDARVSAEWHVNSVISDETGYTVLGSMQGFKPANLADREHIKVHAERDSGQLFISKPILARVAQRQSIIATRRINKPGGEYGGVVGIGVDPYYFTNFYKQVNLGKNGLIALVGRDGIVRARLSDTSIEIGHDIGNTELFKRLNSSDAGSFITHAAVDGVRRILSYRVLRGYPLVVTVGVAEDVAMAEVDERKAYYYDIAAIVTLLLLIGAWVLLKLLRSTDRGAQLLLQMNETLTQNAADLASVNRELKAFSHSISHDLKSPLRGIDGYATLLLQEFGDKLGDKGRKYVENVRRGTLQMNRLIADLLAYAHVEQAGLARDKVELQPLVADLLAERAAEIAAANISVTNLVPALTAIADRRVLDMALRNLLDNALKFTEGTPAPAVEVGAREDGTSIQIWVKDNGLGFDMAYHDRIFEVFQRLNRTETYPGTGIGLAMVRKAMERMRGRVWARSEPGKGATFYLELPQ